MYDDLLVVNRLQQRIMACAVELVRDGASFRMDDLVRELKELAEELDEHQRQQNEYVNGDAS